ncbi:MAG: hypothetical protein JO286_02295 [Solirubrobacterales bacterium]|nr:hypothetical protein [Solirubrobacterales bacterium]MBV9365344.1 hypothetical protein [Solirubrobacterales bacterium]MBV9681444.1 hypothetical protein [Solirubrobacterales bacterium]MBV9805980.1 hypothetical protein [Solirubrobacterales bacterium]
MKVKVRIDTLALDGLDLTHRERDELIIAIQREMRLPAPRAPVPEAQPEPTGPPGSRVDTVARHVALAVSRLLPAAHAAALPAGGRR